MKIRRLIPSHIDHRAARLLVVAAVGLAGVGAAAGAAQADTGYVVTWSQPYIMTASYDFLNVAVADSSRSNGGRIIQWAADGGSEQEWSFGTETVNGVYQGTFIANVNSGLCMNTDGGAGDQLLQETCYLGDNDELFYIHGSLGGYDSFSNVATGWYIDVNGYSWNEGQGIDLWYQNNQPNQTFATLAW